MKILSYRRYQYNFINADSDSTTAGSLDILIQFGNIWNQQKSAGRTFHLLDTTKYVHTTTITLKKTLPAALTYLHFTVRKSDILKCGSGNTSQETSASNKCAKNPIVYYNN